MNSSQIRKDKRQLRSKLSAEQLDEAAINLANNAAQLITQINNLLNDPSNESVNVLSYLPIMGEISPHKLVEQLNPEINIFLPLITDYDDCLMSFYSANNPLKKNKFNILEPSTVGEALNPKSLNVVLAPLVAFDKNCHRIGMGGGFYDRAFEFTKRQKDNTLAIEKKLIMVGLAHSLQEVEQIKPEPWDVPLNMVITDQQIFLSKT